jgi:hypothetical protein
MRHNALRLLGKIAADAQHKTDSYGLSVRVRDETSREVYRANLSIHGEAVS